MARLAVRHFRHFLLPMTALRHRAPWRHPAQSHGVLHSPVHLQNGPADMCFLTCVGDVYIVLYLIKT